MATQIVTNVGLDRVLEQMLSGVSHVAVGSGANTPALGDTTLQTELTRVVTVEETASASGGIGTAVIEAFFATGEGNGTIREWGVLDAASNGNLYFHGQPTAAVVKTSAKQMRVTLTVTLVQT